MILSEWRISSKNFVKFRMYSTSVWFSLETLFFIVFFKVLVKSLNLSCLGSSLLGNVASFPRDIYGDFSETFGRWTFESTLAHHWFVRAHYVSVCWCTCLTATSFTYISDYIRVLSTAGMFQKCRGLRSDSLLPLSPNLEFFHQVRIEWSLSHLRMKRRFLSIKNI